MASDGVWDNLFEKDIIECIKLNMPDPIDKNISSKFLNKSKEAADCIANKSETLGNTIGY